MCTRPCLCFRWIGGRSFWLKIFNDFVLMLLVSCSFSEGGLMVICGSFGRLAEFGSGWKFSLERCHRYFSISFLSRLTWVLSSSDAWRVLNLSSLAYLRLSIMMLGRLLFCFFFITLTVSGILFAESYSLRPLLAEGKSLMNLLLGEKKNCFMF